MKILKIGKLPKVRDVKYRCKHCGSTFLLNDKDFTSTKLYFFVSTPYNYIDCPACGMSVKISSRQCDRMCRYKRALDVQRKWYGPEANNDRE